MLHNSQEGEKQRAASLEWTKRLPFLLIMITATTIGSGMELRPIYKEILPQMWSNITPSGLTKMGGNVSRTSYYN